MDWKRSWKMGKREKEKSLSNPEFKDVSWPGCVISRYIIILIVSICITYFTVN